MTLKAFSTLRGVLKTASFAAAIGAFSVGAIPAAAQTTAAPSTENPLGIPEDFTIYGNENPNERSATAVVNGYVITGTDIDQRVALVTNAAQLNSAIRLGARRWRSRLRPRL